MGRNSIDRLTDGISRLKTQLKFADGLMEVYPDNGCASEIDAVKKHLAQHEHILSADSIDNFVSECEAMMSKTASHAKSITTHCVSHAHIDMNWKWGYDETVAVTLDTFTTMLKLMEKYPAFKFSQSQASVYGIVEEFNPAMLEQIKKHVKEGRWELSSSTWVEGDKNMASGESQIRQVLYTKRYFKNLFGADYDDITLDFEPDTFGHNSNVPMILASAGVKYYYHCRGYEGPRAYKWIAPTGQSLICYFQKADWYNFLISPDTLCDSMLEELRDTKLRDILRVYGVGDHGGGPTVRDIEGILKMSQWPVFPTIKFSTYADYFSSVEACGADLPEHRGEHNYVFTGCYTSQSEVKTANRYGERHLAEAEVYSSIASKISSDFAYPAKNLENAWRKHLFNQFHDILPGSGIRETREYSMGKFQEIMAATSCVKKSALAAISGCIDTRRLLSYTKAADSSDFALGGGVGFLQRFDRMSQSGLDDAGCRIYTVHNPLPFARSEIVEIVLWDMKYEGGLVVKDADGNDVDHQVIDMRVEYCQHEFQTILIEAKNVPALGYKSFVIYEDPEVEKYDGNEPILRVQLPLDCKLENEFIKAELDEESGAVKSLIIKESGTELVPHGAKTALFRIIDEASLFDGIMSSWITGSESRIEPVSGVTFGRKLFVGKDRNDTLERSTMRSINGPLRKSIMWQAKVRNSTVTVGISLEKGSKHLRIDCKCDWLEDDLNRVYVPQLNIDIPVAMKDPKHTFEVPFGVIEREVTGLEAPTLRWADVSGSSIDGAGSIGMTVATDSKYGYKANKNGLSVSLLRSTFDPDPHPEYGEHRFSIALMPHNGICDYSDACKNGASFDQPLQVFQTDAHDGTLPCAMSFMSVRNDNVVMSALKMHEDGSGLILRLYEIEGKDTNAEIAISPELFGGDISATELDSIEDKQGSRFDSKDGVLCIQVPAYGVVSLLLEKLAM